MENTTTAQIAKECGTSESQLVKYFQNKEGLIRAIFEDGWRRLSFVYMASTIASEPEERLRIIFELFLKALAEDPELRDLFLFEGRRSRHKTGDIIQTAGYFHLTREIEHLTDSVLSKNAKRPALSAKAAASALIGTVESMLRDQSLSIRQGGKPQPADDEIRTMFHLVIDGFSGKLG